MINFNINEFFLVTGASSGIGRAVSLLINELGGTIIAVGRNKEKLDKEKKSCTYSDRYHIEIKDLTKNLDHLNKWVISLSKKYGKLKGLVLAAGIRHTIPLKALSIKQIESLFNINLYANIMLVKGFASKQVNIGDGSSIVFISSISALTGGLGIIDYSASKAAINAIVKSMALELSKDGIRVNSVLPGYVLTDLIRNDKYLVKYFFKYKVFNRIHTQRFEMSSSLKDQFS